MTGALTLSGAPTVDLHAATKLYVDAVAGSATAAASSAAAAEASYDSFDDRYLGAKAAPPTLDNDGNALIEGALYWNSVTDTMFAWTGSAWGSISSTADIFRYHFIATGGETSLSGMDEYGNTLSYLPGKEQVYLNGVLLVRTTDYTATSGTSITALAALAGISAKFGKFIYIPFGIVTLIQFVGNFFYSYSYIDTSSLEFLNWVDMISGLLEPMGIDPSDMVSHRRILAFLTGGMIPFISLTFAHMLIVYSSKNKKDSEFKIDIDIEQLSREIGKKEYQNTEEKINPTPEELEELQRKLSELQNQSSSDVVNEDSDGLKRLSYTKNG